MLFMCWTRETGVIPGALAGMLVGMKAPGAEIIAAVTFLTAFAALAVGYRVLGVPFSLMLGMVAGIHTQPAVLGYALEQTGNEIPNVGYTSVYPAATIGKILLVQVLLALS